METTRIGKRGTLVIPVKLRQRFALQEGDLLVTEEREDGILLRPAIAVPVEIYTPERKAEFLLNNAVTQEDYDDSCRIIRDDFGLNPAEIPHTDPRMRARLPSNAEFDKRMSRTNRRIGKEQSLRRKHA
ncbi:MAG: AbrB/MazE/SpoVT family DNA-binding domain-containing protein [Acidobacteriaceae bacterium]|jgi:AbrB family looped-hinge helix DNA binding protein